MGGDDIMTQSRFGRKSTFQFGEDKLTFTASDPTGRMDGTVLYEMIDPDNTSTIKVNAGQRFYPLIIIVGVLGIIAISAIPSLAGPFIITIALMPIFIVICIWVLRFSNVISVTFTIMSVRNSGAVNRIRIINDKQHDQIVARIKAARIARIRRLHLPLNPAAPPAEEAKKFKWLLDHGIIDEAEHRAAISQLPPGAQHAASTWDPPDANSTMN